MRLKLLKTFFSLILFAGLLTQFSTPVYALCTLSGVGKCGSNGGCDEGEMCERVGATGIFHCIQRSACCTDTGGQCYNTCPIGQSYTGPCPNNQYCCKPMSNPCLDANLGYVCRRQSPGTGYVQVNLACSEQESKCWKPPADITCSADCYQGTSCPDSTSPASGTCHPGQVCCRRDNPSGCKQIGQKCSRGQTGLGSCCPGFICSELTGICSLDPTKDPYIGPKITSWEALITPIARALYYGGLFIGFCFIVYAGYGLMTSEGNPQKTQSAQEQLTAAILGIIFILLSAAILRVIINSIIGGSVSV